MIGLFCAFAVTRVMRIEVCEGKVFFGRLLKRGFSVLSVEGFRRSADSLDLIRLLYNAGLSGCYLVSASPYDYKVRFYVVDKSLFKSRLSARLDVKRGVLGGLVRALYPYSSPNLIEVNEREFYEPVGVPLREFRFYRNSIVVELNGVYAIGFVYFRPECDSSFHYDNLNLFLRSVCENGLNVKVNVSFKPLRRSLLKLLNVKREIFEFEVSCIISIISGPFENKKIAYNKLKHLKEVVRELLESIYHVDVKDVSFFGLGSVLRSLLAREVNSLFSFNVDGFKLASLIQFPEPLLPSFSYEVKYEPIFDLSSLINLPRDGLLLGFCETPWGNVEVKLAVEDLPLNLAIFGVPGSGKTRLTKRLIREFIEEFEGNALVFDRHGEYHDLNDIASIVKVGCDDFSVNPLKFVGSVGVHVKRLAEIFEMTWPDEFGPVMSYVFRKTCNEYLLNCKRNSVPPTLMGYVNYLEELISGPPMGFLRASKFRDKLVSLASRLSELTLGSLERVFNSKTGEARLEELLGGSLILDLSYLDSDRDKNIFTWFILKEIFDARRRSLSKKVHVIVCEEAHNVVPTKFEGKPTIIEYFLKEMRKFNESIWLIDQRPLAISRDALALCGTMICLRLQYSSDVRKLGDTLGLSEEQARYVQKLQRGKAVVITPRTVSPILVELV